MSRLIDADALIADCQLAQKQADRHGREFANAFYSGGGEVSTEWWCVEDMIENAPTIEARKKGRWIHDGYDVPHGVDWIHCSECGRREPNVPAAKTPYCPGCGSDNREEGEE